MSRILHLLLPLSVAAAAATAAPDDYQTTGVVDNLPVFHRSLSERLQFPLSWTSGAYADFGQWRSAARQEVVARLLSPPPNAPWNAMVLDEQDRGRYVARKVVLNITGDSRVLAYMTVPKGAGPFPAVLLLHSHSGVFDVGKEKVIRPWGVPPEKLESAEKLVAKEYDGRFLGDVLAARGYVCLAIDVLNWSDRAGDGYAGQAQLAANLMHLGMSLSGLIAWEDQRAAEFLAQQPEVDARRIAAVGMSMGGQRAWQVAALSDRIAAAVSVCWINVVQRLMTPGNNQTKSHSAFTSLHPGLLAQLDYPDIASIACPKPMLFYNGRTDALFPQDGVDQAYAKMRAVWSSQQAGDRLVTRTWPGGHVFTAEMQDTAFTWLDEALAGRVAEQP